MNKYVKGLKLSKTAWLVLGAGVFFVSLVGLGVVRAQQMQEETQLADDLVVSEQRLDKLQINDLSEQLEALREQVADSEEQLEEAQARLKRTVASADVVEEFFSIAEYSNVVIWDITNSTISSEVAGGVKLSMTSVNARVAGEFDDILGFVINLNNGFPTGYVKTVQITNPIEEEEEEPPPGMEGAGGPQAIIQLKVFSYEEL